MLTLVHLGSFCVFLSGLSWFKVMGSSFEWWCDEAGRIWQVQSVMLGLSENLSWLTYQLVTTEQRVETELYRQIITALISFKSLQGVPRGKEQLVGSPDVHHGLPWHWEGTKFSAGWEDDDDGRWQIQHNTTKMMMMKIIIELGRIQCHSASSI